MKLSSGAAPVREMLAGGPAAGPGHRRRRQQQRPRHVRGDADGRAPGQARHRRSRPRRPRAAVLEMATLGGARALGMEDRPRLAGGGQARRPGRGRPAPSRACTRSTTPSPTSSTRPRARTCATWWWRAAWSCATAGSLTLDEAAVLAEAERLRAQVRREPGAVKPRRRRRAPAARGPLGAAPHREPQPAQPRPGHAAHADGGRAAARRGPARARGGAARARARSRARPTRWRARWRRAGASSSWAPAPAAGWASWRRRSARRPSAPTRDRIRAVMAGGEGAVFRAVEGAEDRGDDGAREGRRLRPRDLLDRHLGQLGDARSCAARSAAARARGARTVLVTCAPEPGLRPAGRRRDRDPHGPRGAHRLHAPQGRLGHQGRAQRHHHRGHGAAGQGLREPDGGPAARATPSSRTARAASWPPRPACPPTTRRRACSRAAGGEVKTAIVMGRLGVRRGSRARAAGPRPRPRPRAPCGDARCAAG